MWDKVLSHRFHSHELLCSRKPWQLVNCLHTHWTHEYPSMLYWVHMVQLNNNLGWEIWHNMIMIAFNLLYL